jgi:protease secretion system outer membrane protein
VTRLPLLNRRLLAGAVAQALGLALLAHSGGAAALGLMDAYQAALQNDPTFQSAVHDRESGAESRILGRSTLLPQVAASYAGSKNRADQTAHDNLGHEATQHPVYISRNATLQVRQTVFNLDALARYRQGLAQDDYSSAQFAARKQDLIIRLIGAYTDALYAQEQLRLAQGQRAAYLEQHNVNTRLFEKGEGTKTDVLETQARLDLAEAQVLEASDNVQNSRNALAAIVGQEITALDDLAPDFRVPDAPAMGLEEWKAIALQNNPEMAAQRFAIEASRQEVNKNKAGHLPRVDVVGSYSKGAADTLNTYNQDSTVRSIGVQVNIPLYSGGSVSATTRQAVAGQEKAKSDLQATTDRVMVELRKQYAVLVSSVSRIHALEKAVESGKLLTVATQQSIKGGVRINLDLLNAQQQMYTSQRDLAQARYVYLQAVLKLRSASGTLNEETLREVAAYFR